MANESRLTYYEPKDKFKKINMNVILKFDPVVVGIYCKLVTMSSGKSLSIDFLSKRLKISKERMRKTIVFLESEGYITREAIRDKNGYMSGWNYCLFAEPVDEKERTRAGLKKAKKGNEEEKPRVSDSPCYGISDNTENAKEKTIIDNNISNSDIDIVKDIDKRLSNDNQKDRDFEIFMRKHYPYLMKMDKPLTLEQATQLKKQFGEDIVLNVFEAMDNYKPLLKKYRDAYRVAINWCKIRMTNDK